MGVADFTLIEEQPVAGGDIDLAFMTPDLMDKGIEWPTAPS